MSSSPLTLHEDRLLREEIGWFRTGRPTIGITAQSHPEEFLQNLHKNFHGSYFWCSRATAEALPHTTASVKALWPYLTLDERRGMANLAETWREPKVLASWGRLRLEIDWVRNL